MKRNVRRHSSMRFTSLLLLCVVLLATFKFVTITRRSVNGPPVPVTLFVMSKCPDAAACEATFLKVLKQVNPLTELKTEYIGQPNRNATYGVRCKHGEAECYGNIQELCFQRVYSGEQLRFLQWLRCLNKNLDNKGTTEHAQACLDEVHRDGDPVHECANSDEGRMALRDSVRTVKANGVTKSCTVFIDGEKTCIRDGGQWYDCPEGHKVGDFVRVIKERYYARAIEGPTE